MGIIVFVVVILFILGVGGMQLYWVEIFGLVKDLKMIFRIVDMVKYLWYIYLFLIMVCIVVYWLVGMNWFDVICYFFFIIVIGGFLIYDVSLGYFNSFMVNVICVVFLLIVVFNFLFYYVVVSGCNIKGYWQDFEFKVFLFIQVVLILVCFMVLVMYNQFSIVEEVLDQVVI